MTASGRTGDDPGGVPHHDVLIIGAGLSGIGAACQLQVDCPELSVAILEARDSLGGTWDLFRYPGIRSDSDMHTFGYRLRPWTQDTGIAEGKDILDYIAATARERGVTDQIQFGTKVVKASWDHTAARWTVTTRTADGATRQASCSFLWCCTGYYDYDQGFTPTFPGMAEFRGEVVHPQHWPTGQTVEGRRIAVIGSGATAITLVPALARTAEHVTMIQRSPTYVMSLPRRDPLDGLLRRILPEQRALRISRWKNVLFATLAYNLSRRFPRLMRAMIRRANRAALPAGYDVDTHFRPSYDPWDQRMCLDPDGEFFQAIRRGKASIVTDEIATFTESAVRLRSGAEIEADLLVTATGLNLLTLGGVHLEVGGSPVPISETVTYKGLMLSGVPNLALTIGYTNASWTLKADLVAAYVCRLLNHMKAMDYASATPVAPRGLATRPLIDLASNYVRRAERDLPRQGEALPWRLYQNYFRDHRLLAHGRLDDAVEFSPRRATASARPASSHVRGSA